MLIVISTDETVALAMTVLPRELEATHYATFELCSHKIRIEDARVYVAEVAPRVSWLLEEIEHTLRPVWEPEMRGQGARGIVHKPGDLLWRDKVGWAVCLDEARDLEGHSIKVRLKGVEKAVMVGYYVNVSELGVRNTALGGLVSDLRRCAV